MVGDILFLIDYITNKYGIKDKYHISLLEMKDVVSNPRNVLKNMFFCNYLRTIEEIRVNYSEHFFYLYPNDWENNPSILETLPKEG